MRLFARIFLSHLLAIVVACAVVAVAIGLISPEFYNQHIDSLMHTRRVEDPGLQGALEAGHKQLMLQALLVSLPSAVLLAAATAYLTTHRVVGVVRRLVEKSGEVAQGEYGKRLAVTGNDELAELARHFNHMAARLEETRESQAQFIGAVAHELGTPLTALQGYAEALLDGVMPPKRAARSISREVDGLRRVANDLLLVTQVETGTLELRCAAYQPEELVAEAHDRFLYAFEEKGVHLGVELTDLPPVFADRERVGQVLGNLLANALRFTPKSGRVVLGVSAGDGEVRFSVTDNGAGIPPEARERVFERFYRGDAARRREGGGTGVGLTVAKGLVEAMGGRMGLESEEGLGSTFFFSCPLFSERHDFFLDTTFSEPDARKV